MQVQEFMTPEVVTISWNNDLRLVDDIMAELHIHHLPVLEDDHIIGLITQRDVFKARISSVMERDESGQRVFLHSITVKEIMTHPVVTISSQASVNDAADLMLTNLIGCLPVMQDDQLVGIITKTDLLHRLCSLSPTRREVAALNDGQDKKQTGRNLPNTLPNWHQPF